METIFLISFTLVIALILFLEAKNNVPKIEMKTFGQRVITKYIPDPVERAKISTQFRAFDKKWHYWSAIRIGLLPFIIGGMLVFLMFGTLSFWNHIWIGVWMFFLISILSTGLFQLFINLNWDAVGTWHIDTTSWVNTTILPKTIWMYWAAQVVFLIIIYGLYPALKFE